MARTKTTGPEDGAKEDDSHPWSDDEAKEIYDAYCRAYVAVYMGQAPNTTGEGGAPLVAMTLAVDDKAEAEDFRSKLDVCVKVARLLGR